MAPPSALEQACVMKGGLACVIGSSRNGYHFDIIVMDYLLEQILKSLRYEQVYCLCLDRSRSAFEGYEKAHSKLHVVEIATDSLLQDLDPFLKSLRFIHHKALNHKRQIALVLGDDKAMNYLFELQSISLGTCLVAVHETLHDVRYVNRIQAECQIVATVQQNTGMYQENVLCEVTVLRKSKTTGKVSEEYDLFIRNDAQDGIVALHHKEEVNDEKEDVVAAPQTLSDLSAAKASAISTEHTVEIAPIKNLVLFDRTDPEFDEDSDPDADLDL